MKTRDFSLIIFACALFVGCAKTVRSISQTQYQNDAHYVAPPARELDEFDVLGVDRGKTVTEEEIQRVASQNKPLQLASGSTILLIQSGAIYPDGPMVTQLSKHFRVVPFTGVAEENKIAAVIPIRDQTTRNVAVITDPDKPVTIVPMSTLAKERYRTESAPKEAPSYSRTLRLAAARAGASTVICYWGILESGNESLPTKTVSWLPIVNWVMPDERQHMRIRLKIAMVDVASGSWSVFSAEPLESKSWSISPRREVADQKQVEAIKQKAYELAAQGLVKAYIN
jgi:hypothetical protein